jgi:threonine/homoserine efflux transporter RhtA
MNEFSKKIVALVIMLNVAFTGVVLYLFLITGSEPTTLIGCWFGFTTVELWALSGITKTKITQGGNRELRQ